MTLASLISPAAREARLQNYVPVPETGCWLWLGCWNVYKYGLCNRPFISGVRRKYGAHRFFYEALIGPIPPGMYVMHSCDTPPCVNPAHLSIGTHADNQHDRALKGRARGAGNGRAVLSEEQALRIRSMTNTTQRSLATLFGVSCTTIRDIRTGRSWSHLQKSGGAQ